MQRLRFILTSEQLELLIAFEHASGLSHLSELMARDPSVVSRNLQRIAEICPVLKKEKGRWTLTPLGKQLNQRTKIFLEEKAKLFSQVEPRSELAEPDVGDDTALIIINAQNALIDATKEGRNNLDAEKNITRILGYWRQRRRRIIHVKHVSDSLESMFHRDSDGCKFLSSVVPLGDEIVIEKMKSSAFFGTSLEDVLNQNSISNIVLVGFTASECIDATAKDSAALGFTAFVVGDGTATFDLRDPSGKLIKADRIHRLTLANINAFYARVVSTEEILVSADSPQ